MARVGVLVYPKKIRERATAKPYFDNFANMGLLAVVGEIDRSRHSVEYIAPHKINDCDYVLVSLVSAWDILSLIHYVPKDRRAKVIVGGQGLVNPLSYLDRFDIGVFGRAEGQINDILDGGRPDNVLDTAIDPEAEGRYVYRQAIRLVPGEKNVGCDRRCYFCAYGWTHGRMKKGLNYDSADDHIYGSSEQMFGELTLNKNVHYIAGIDGYSEESRGLVGKAMSDADIENKLVSLTEESAHLGFARLSIKLYTIHGYPWEKPIQDYTRSLTTVCGKADKRLSSGRCIIFLKTTPFCPEPLTPMARCRADFNDKWRRLLRELWVVYSGRHIECRIHMTVPSSAELALMVFFRRAGQDMSDVAEIIASPRYQRMRPAGKIVALSIRGVLDKLNDNAPWPGLYVPGINPENIARARGWM